MSEFPSIFQNNQAEPSQNPFQSQQVSQQNYNQTIGARPSGPFNQTSPPYANLLQQQQQVPQMMSAGQYTSACLPTNLLEQIRSCGSSPIFILPVGSGCPLQQQQQQQQQQPQPQPQVCPPTQILQPTCVPYPMPLPIFQPYNGRPRESECKCCGGSGSSSTRQKNPFAEAYENWEKNCNNANSVQQQQHQRMDSESSENGIGGLNSPPSEHQCRDTGTGDLVCSQKNCPASIQLQAMIAQLLSVQGLIPSAITRLLLRRIPASNISDTEDIIMERATRCIRQLGKEHLLRESGAIREINGLLGNYLTSPSTHARLIPLLTSAQLKANVLRSLLEGVVSSRIMQEQGCGGSGGAEAPDPLDPLLLELKSDDELRQLLAQLRERQCDERVNLGFASCASQQIVAQSRLVNVERKIGQIETEFERRRRQAGLLSSTNCRQDQRTATQAQDLNRTQTSSGSCRINDTRSSLGCPTSIQSALNTFDSPDPFANVCVRNPKKLFLKPHVGSPETTYAKSNDNEKSNCQEPENPSDDDCCVGCENPCTEETPKCLTETWGCLTDYKCHKTLQKEKSSSDSTYEDESCPCTRSEADVLH